MAQDTFAQIWGRLLLRCPSLSPKLAQDLTRNAFRRLAERRRWSWLIKYGQFLAPASYSTGTVSVTNASDAVTGSGTTWTAAMVGRQFRVGTDAPIYTVASFISATSITLDAVYGGDTDATASYEIYQCFFTVPDDFSQFVTLWDPQYNWQLALDIDQRELNMRDAQRSSAGSGYCVSFRDYSRSAIGQVAQPIQVIGSGDEPISAGTYTGPADAVFTVEITTGGASGTAVFRWKKDEGSYTSTVTTDANGFAQTLQDGVQVAFPTGNTYVDDDIWVVRATAGSAPGTPRYEIWPHEKAQKPYPFLYEQNPDDLSDSGAVLPHGVRGDVLMEMAIAEVARWPGTASQPNPYFNLALARMHDDRAEPLINELELSDDSVWVQDLEYQYPAIGWGYASFMDAAWLQSHAI